LFVEISQLQRLSIYLGNPTAALSVVLFSMLLFSGIGSMLVEVVVRPGRPGLLVAPLGLLLVVLVLFESTTPGILRATEDQTTLVRVGIAVAILFPISLLMGMPFAIGMRAANRRAAAPTAFLWGINGATSVCASVLGTTVSIFFGISTAFAAGVVSYAIALIALSVSNRRRAQPLAPVAAEIETVGLDRSLEPA
jgi:hypothetical protein